MPGLREFKRLNLRKTSVVHVGGFKPTLDPLSTNFGMKPVALPGEPWPAAETGAPLPYICQLNLNTAPIVPPLLEDIKLLTLFATLKDDGQLDSCLRAYKSLEGLSPLA